MREEVILTINIVSVGKLKEGYLREASAEYEKRIKGFSKINIMELNESRLPDNPSEALIEKALSDEATMMESYLSGKSFNIAMCIEGKQLSSEKLSKKLDETGVLGYSTVNFFIGSSFGLSEKVKQQCHLRLSMSEMTFPHQLARIMLLEQIYRAFTIIHNRKYHK